MVASIKAQCFNIVKIFTNFKVKDIKRPVKSFTYKIDDLKGLFLWPSNYLLSSAMKKGQGE